MEISGPISTEALLHPQKSTKALWQAVAQIYKEGGFRGYWVGNGLNVVKIFPVRMHPSEEVGMSQVIISYRNLPSNSCPTNLRYVNLIGCLDVVPNLVTETIFREIL